MERRPEDLNDAEVDPRIAARRQSVEVERRRRRRRRLLIGLGVVVTVAAGWFATRTALLDIDRIQVEGAVHERTEDVLSSSGLQVGDQLLDVDAGAISARIEQLPWIASAEVSTSLGGVATITVTERVPVATVADPMGGRHLVDATGRLLGPADGDTSGLASLEGVTPGGPGETIEGAQGALEAIDALGDGARSRVLAVVASPDGTLQFRLNPQGVVLLGPPTELTEKAASLTTVLGRVEQRDLKSVSVIDPLNPVVVRNQA